MTAAAEAKPSEFSLSDKEFAIIAETIRDEAGIALSPQKASLVYSRLAKRVRALGLSGFPEYCGLIRSPEGEEERRHLLSALTTNVTHFFREPHHFQHLETVVGPELIERARRGERVRLWSAACSSGQEPYSIALTLLRVAPDLASANLKILATDIDPEILAKARAGEYEGTLLEKVPQDLRKKYFSQADKASDLWRVNDEVKSLITFKPMNLIRPWPVKGPFDAIFCRNVVIYFEDETEQAVWSQFANVLTPGGHLYIGHSERVSGAATAAFEPAGVTTYQKL